MIKTAAKLLRYSSPDPRGEVREQVTLYRLARAEFGERPGRTRRGGSS